MNALAEKLDEAEVVSEIGTVMNAGAELAVRTARGLYRARRAFSCLIEPAQGDLVLVAVTVDGRAFVMSILERTGGEAAAVKVEGDLRVVAAGGRLSFASTEGVDIGTGKDINLASETLSVRSREGKLLIDGLTYLGRFARVEAETVKSVVSYVDHVFERLSQKVRRSYRFVEEIDMTRAEQIDMRANQNVHVRAANAVIAADQLVKVDGKQIHLG
jgi:hypothetical protein